MAAPQVGESLQDPPSLNRESCSTINGLSVGMQKDSIPVGPVVEELQLARQTYLDVEVVAMAVLVAIQQPCADRRKFESGSVQV